MSDGRPTALLTSGVGPVSNVTSRLCHEAHLGQILISPRALTKVENAVKAEPVGEFELTGIDQEASGGVQCGRRRIDDERVG
jgi:class 3 adenylate cyclase